MSLDLRHWHRLGDEPSRYTDLPNCCRAQADDEHHRAVDTAVHAERVRVVNQSLDAIDTYRAAAASVLDPVSIELLEKITAACVKAIGKVGCICPRIEVTTFGGPPQFLPGLDHRCGLHNTKETPRAQG